jgi:hypothetical protein
MRVRNLLKDKDDEKPVQADLVAISLYKDDIELLNKSLQDLKTITFLLSTPPWG